MEIGRLSAICQQLSISGSSSESPRRVESPAPEALDSESAVVEAESPVATLRVDLVAGRMGAVGQVR